MRNAGRAREFPGVRGEGGRDGGREERGRDGTREKKRVFLAET